MTSRKPQNPWRPARHYLVPRDLVARLDKEALRRGIATEKLVEEILIDALPDLLATAAREFLVGSMRRADAFDNDETI